MDARFGFIEIEPLRNAWAGIRTRARGRHGSIRRFHIGRRAVAARAHRIGLARGALPQSGGPLLLLEFERSAGAFSAGEQGGIVDAPGGAAVDLGKQRAARVRCNSCNRSRARTKAEAMQAKRRFYFRIERHAALLLNANARHPDAGMVRDGNVNIAARPLFRS